MPSTREVLRRMLGGVGHPAVAMRIGLPVNPDDPPPGRVSGAPAPM